MVDDLQALDLFHHRKVFAFRASPKSQNFFRKGGDCKVVLLNS
jgi:hypothetical protein